MTSAPQVIYLTGWGRSGSTVLNRLLVGEGVAAVGEMRYLWQRGVIQRQDCSCGHPWDDCALWGPVVHGVLAAHNVGDAGSAAAKLHELGEAAGRQIRRDPGQGDPGRSGATVGRYASLLAQLYQDVATQTGARLIVDSSKDPAHALLARASGVPVTVVHLVRDPRAVVWSHQRAKAPPPGATANVTERHGAFYVATRWTLRNSFIDRHVHPDLRIRYEDLVADTATVTAAILQAAGVEAPASEGGVEHLISGNPNRFETSRPKVLREDAEWREAQPARQKRLTTLIASRAMRRYGYQ